MSENSNSAELLERIRLLELELDESKTVVKDVESKLLSFKMAAEGARDGLWDWDVSRNVKFISTPWLNMLGYTQIEYDVNKPGAWEELIHPDDRVEVSQRFNDFVKSNEKSYAHEIRVRHKNGSYRWILSKGSAIRAESGEAIRMSGSITDITNDKLSKEDLKRSENKFRSLFENSMVGMFRAKKEKGVIEEANAKFWELLNVVSGNRENRKISAFFADKTEYEKILELIISVGEIEGVEVELNRDDGSKIWVLFSVSISKSDSLLECVLKDITETRNNFLELQKVNFELDSFVYHASHDLRSPLRSVLGLIGLYRMDEDPRNRDTCIEKMEASVKRLDSLVIELLSISRNNRIDDPMVPVHFMSEVSNSVSSYSNSFDSKTLEILSNIKQPVPFISDVTRIRIILNNIISNAMKYRSFGKERSYVLIDVIVDEEKATLTVEDNGEGIPESKIEGVFDMFFRATEKSEGSGLGLYIVKNVAQKLNAQIKIESEELEGTKVTVEIPNNIP